MKEKEKQKRDWLPGVLMAAAISFCYFYMHLWICIAAILTSSGLISTYCLEWRQ